MRRSCREITNRAQERERSITSCVPTFATQAHVPRESHLPVACRVERRASTQAETRRGGGGRWFEKVQEQHNNHAPNVQTRLIGNHNRTRVVSSRGCEQNGENRGGCKLLSTKAQAQRINGGGGGRTTRPKDNARTRSVLAPRAAAEPAPLVAALAARHVHAALIRSAVVGGNGARLVRNSCPG